MNVMPFKKKKNLTIVLYLVIIVRPTIIRKFDQKKPRKQNIIPGIQAGS